METPYRVDPELVTASNVPCISDRLLKKLVAIGSFESV
jgi:hypothetical protein